MNGHGKIVNFYAHALLSVYECQSVEEIPIFLDNHDHNFAQLHTFEDLICKKTHSSNKGIVNLIHQFEVNDHWKQLHWRCDVIFDRHDPMNPKYRVNFLSPSLERASEICSEHLGCHRFLFVTINGLPSSQEIGENVTSQFWKQHWAALQLFRSGIIFGGNCYKFLGGELNKIASFGDVEKDRCMQLWFFCEHPLLSGPSIDYKSEMYKCQQNASLPIPYHQFFSIDQLRSHLGNLSTLTIGKCNARIKLGFSSIFPWCLPNDIFIRLIPDIESTTTSSDPSLLLSDGCGLIAADVIEGLPYAIHHGVAQTQGPRASHMPWPILLQVRCLCSLGLFKGCLLVTSDTSLCPSKTIYFRPSMQKNAKLELNFLAKVFWQNNPPIFGIVDTFEHASWLPATSSTASNSAMAQNTKIIGAIRDISSFSARLNRPLCLLLHARGVPLDWFLQKLRVELEKELSALSDRNNAFCIVKDWLSEKVQLLELSISLQKIDPVTVVAEVEEVEDIDEEEEELSINEEYDDTTICGDDSLLLSVATHIQKHASKHKKTPHQSIFNEEKEIEGEIDKLYGNATVNHMDMEDVHTRMLTRSLQLLDMLLAGHAVDKDIYLQQQLRMFIFQRISHLIKCQIRVPGSLYLVGTPDPFSILPPNTVFIALPNDRLIRESESNTSHTSNAASLLHPTGRVLVTRNPMQHPGDLRLLQAIYLSELANLVAPSNSGVIFFSTQGTRSAADEMSGGDFDGDKYFILFDQEYVPTNVNETHRGCTNNNSLLSFIQPCEPFSDQPTASSATTKAADIANTTSSSKSTSNTPSKTTYSTGVTTVPTTSSTDTPPKPIVNTHNPNNTINNNIDTINNIIHYHVKNPILSAFIPTTSNSTPGTSSSFAPLIDRTGWCIFDSLLVTSQTQTIGRYANAWLSWADALSPVCSQAIQCAHIVKIALDAAKTGQSVATPKHLWRQAPVLLWQMTTANDYNSYGNKRISDVDKVMLLVQQYLLWRQKHQEDLRQMQYQSAPPTGKTMDTKRKHGNNNNNVNANNNIYNNHKNVNYTDTHNNETNSNTIPTSNANTLGNNQSETVRNVHSSVIGKSHSVSHTPTPVSNNISPSEKKSRWHSLKHYVSPLVNTFEEEKTVDCRVEKEEVQLSPQHDKFDDEDDIISDVTFLDTVMSRTYPCHINPVKNHRIPQYKDANAINETYNINSKTINNDYNNINHNASKNDNAMSLMVSSDNKEDVHSDNYPQNMEVPEYPEAKNKISFLTLLHHTVLEHVSHVFVDPCSTSTMTTKQHVYIDCSLLLVDNEYAPIITPNHQNQTVPTYHNRINNNITGFEPTNRFLYRSFRTWYGRSLLAPAETFNNNTNNTINNTDNHKTALQELFQRMSFLPMFYDIAKHALFEYKVHMARILGCGTGAPQQQQQQLEKLKRLHRKTFDQTALLLAGYYQALYTHNNTNSSNNGDNISHNNTNNTIDSNNNMEKITVTSVDEIQKKAFLHVARARLASLYYLATYTAAAEKHHTNNKTNGAEINNTNHGKKLVTFAVSFCWEICGAELNLLKTQFVKRSEETMLENVWTVLPRSQLIFMCGL